MKISAILCSTLYMVYPIKVEGFSITRMPLNSLSFTSKPIVPLTWTNSNQRDVVTALAAAKKRRRRRVEGETSMDPLISDPTAMDDDELPDFDLGEKEQLPELLNTEIKEEKPTQILQQISESDMKQSLISDDDPLVKEAMKASKNSQTFESSKDLLRSRDRELESTFEFEEVKTPLPRPGQQKSTSVSSTIADTGGKKRARAEARRAAAMEAAAEEENEVNVDIVNNVLSYLPFYPKTKEGEEVTPLKLLERGTWACIYILIGWELYINSPFFERAAPVIPVVY